MMATVRPRLNHCSLGRRVARFGSRAVSAMAVSRSSTRSSVRSSTATAEPSAAGRPTAGTPPAGAVPLRPKPKRPVPLPPSGASPSSLSAESQISGAVARRRLRSCRPSSQAKTNTTTRPAISDGIIGTKTSATSSLRAVAARAVGPPQGRMFMMPLAMAGDACQDHGAHLQAEVDRQHGRGGEDEGGGAVAVERDAAARMAVPRTTLRGVVAELAQDEPDQRVEEADVDHQAEVDDGEHQQRRGGRHGLHRRRAPCRRCPARRRRKVRRRWGR